jgi:hypothetical protein
MPRAPKLGATEERQSPDDDQYFVEIFRGFKK